MITLKYIKKYTLAAFLLVGCIASTQASDHRSDSERLGANPQVQAALLVDQTYGEWLKEFERWDARVKLSRNKNDVEPWAIQFVEKFTDIGKSVRDKHAELLFQAALTGNTDPLHSIDLKDVDVNVKNKVGITPLMLAVIRGRSEIVQWLCEHMPGMINATSTDDLTALHYAAIANKPNMIDLLFASEGVDLDAVGGPARQTPLMMAIQLKNVGASCRLAVWGASTDCKDVKGKTVAEYAQSSREPAILRAIEAPNQEEMVLQALNEHENPGVSSVVLFDQFSTMRSVNASEAAHVHAMLAESEGKAEPGRQQGSRPIGAEWDADRVPHDANGETVKLFLAAITGNKNLIKGLKVDEIQRNKTNNKGLTALMYAAMHGFDDIVAFICMGGFCDLNYGTKDLLAPVHCAVLAGHRAVLSVLALWGADLNGTSGPQDITPIELAIRCGKLDMVKALVELHGVSVLKNGTPLTVSARKWGRVEIEKYLSTARSSRNASHLFSIACKYRFPQQVDNLLSSVPHPTVLASSMLSIESVENKGMGYTMSPLQLATVYDDLTIADILLGYGARADARNVASDLPFFAALDLAKLQAEKEGNDVCSPVRSKMPTLLINHYNRQSKEPNRSADWQAMTRRDWVGVLPLAAEFDSTVIDALLELDVERVLLHKDPADNSVAHLACKHANVGVVKSVLAASIRLCVPLRDLKNKNNQTLKMLVQSELANTPVDQVERRKKLKEIDKIINIHTQEELKQEKAARQEKHRQEQEAAQRKKQAEQERRDQQQVQKEQQRTRIQEEKEVAQQRKHVKNQQAQQRAQQEAQERVRAEEVQKMEEAERAAEKLQAQARAEQERQAQKKMAQSHKKQQKKEQKKNALAAERYDQIKTLVTGLVDGAVDQAEREIAERSAASIQERRDHANAKLAIVKAFRDMCVDAGLPDFTQGCIDERGIVDMAKLDAGAADLGTRLDTVHAYAQAFDRDVALSEALERVQQEGYKADRNRKQFELNQAQHSVDSLIACFEQGKIKAGLNMIMWGQVNPAERGTAGITIYDYIQDNNSQAAAAEKINSVRAALASHVRKNSPDYLNNRRAHLFGAAMRGDCSVIAKLKTEFKKDARVNQVGDPDDPQERPIYPLRNSLHNIVNALDEDGNTPLFVAVKYGNIAFANELLNEFPTAIASAHQANVRGENVLSLLTYPHAKVRLPEDKTRFVWPIHFISRAYQNIRGIHELKDKILPPVDDRYIPAGTHGPREMYAWCYGVQSTPYQGLVLERSLQPGSAERQYCDSWLGVSQQRREVSAKVAAVLSKKRPAYFNSPYAAMEAHIEKQSGGWQAEEGKQEG